MKEYLNININPSSMAAQNIPQKKTSEATGKYCIITGEEELYSLDANQLKSFYTLLKGLYSSGISLADAQEETELEVEIERNTIWEEDQSTPSVYYSLYSNESEIQMVSYEQIKKISDLLQLFLKQYSGEKYITPDETIEITLAPEKESEFTIEVCEDTENKKRPPVLKSAVNITQRISSTSSQPNVQVEYLLSANELSSDWLTAKGVKTLYKTLEQFIKENHI